jgi:hypothetical protein
MLVYLHEYRTADAGNKRTETSEALDRDTSSYFDVDHLALDEWELLERNGQDLQRRAREFDAVTAVSVPREASDDDLPGRTIQLRHDGGTEHVDNAELIEVQDDDP